MSSQSVFTAGDNLFGVCAAIGDDFGFNPVWLRIAFAVTFLADPAIVAAVYFGLGAVVFVSRLVAPRRAVAVPPTAMAVPAAANSDRATSELIAA